MGGAISHVVIRMTDLPASRKPGRDRVRTGAHIAFTAPDAGSVERWHAAEVRLGGTDNGLPGVRPECSGHDIAAFVPDPDGNNVEAVFHEPR